MASTDSSSRTPLVIGAVAIAALLVTVAFWVLREPPEAEAPEPAEAVADVAPSEPAPESAAPEVEAPRVPAPRVVIADGGRVKVDLASLREGDRLVLGLQLPDAERGDGARPVKIVETTGRTLDVTSQSVTGAGAGLRIEIDPEWLRPGRYMVQVETEPTTPLPLRRYVLEVTEGRGDDAR